MSSLDVFLAVVFWISVFSLSICTAWTWIPPTNVRSSASLAAAVTASKLEQTTGRRECWQKQESKSWIFPWQLHRWHLQLKNNPPSHFFFCKNLQVYVCMYVFWFGFKNRPFSTRRFFRVDYLMMLIAKVGIKRLVKTLPSNWMVSPIWRAMYVMKFLL